jgi:translocation and assembly module TamB
VPVVSGTFAPLKLDGELTARTSNFGVYDRPAEEKSRERIFGVGDAQIGAHLAIRPDALKFLDVRVTLPHSLVEGGMVSIGFHNDLRVDTPKVTADMEDLSPIGPVAMHGKVQVSATVTGTFNHPEPAGDIQSIAGFGVADMQFGDISAGHVKVDVLAPTVEITGVRARRRDSPYEVPTATLKFGGSHGFVVDAVGSSPGFGLRDMLSMFSLDEDPRYDGLEAKIATRAEVHVALGGPEDKCGSGFIGIDGKGHLTDVSLYGERFAQGDADVSLRWSDREAGIAGADIDVRSFVLSKVQPPTGTRAGVTGTVLGSASIRRGGALAGNVMVEGVPLGRVDTLGSFASEVEGSVSGMAHFSGDLDDFHPGASIVTRAELDASATRIRGVAFPSSHLQVEMSQRFAQQKRVLRHTRCGAPVAPPFDKAAFLADTSSHGDWKVNGELFGATVRLTDVVATRAKAPRMSGRVSLRGLDLGALAHIYGARKPEPEDAGASAGRSGESSSPRTSRSTIPPTRAPSSSSGPSSCRAAP